MKGSTSEFFLLYRPSNSSLLTDAERERPEVDREHGFDQASLLTTEDACPHRNIELQGAARGKYY